MVVPVASRDVDLDLLQRWQAGDARAGDLLWKRHQRSVTAFLRRGKARNVEDLVQSTFLAFIEARERFRGNASIRTFLLAIAFRQMQVQRRSERKKERNLDALSILLEEPASPLAELSSLELEQRLREMLPHLDEDLRAVLCLHYWDDLSVAQAAAVLALPYGTIASRLRRAKRKLRSMLDPNP